MAKINVYDFDKTLYKKDASLEFWLFCLRENYLLLLLLPYQIFFYILNKLKIISTKKFKEKFFIFLRFIEKVELNKLLEKFWKKEIKNINLILLEKIKISKIPNICISASPKFLLIIPCKYLKIDVVIGTKFDLDTFKIIGENCKGQEKIKALDKYFSTYDIQNFYSDSYSDLPLFNIAKNKFLLKKEKIYKL